MCTQNLNENMNASPKWGGGGGECAKKRVEHSKPLRKRPFLFMPNRQNSDVSIEYWLKNSTQINSPIVASVAVITSLGKHIFSEEFIQGNSALG